MRGIVACLLLLVATLMLGDRPISAADVQGRAVIHGGVPCKLVTEWREKNTDNALVWWLSGWISAHNRLLPDTFDLANGNMEAMVKQVETFCKFNPSSNLGEAGVTLVNQLQPHRQKAP